MMENENEAKDKPISYHHSFKIRKKENPQELPLESPPLASNLKHRTSCHRCGNLRHFKVYCHTCVMIFCAKCADKMVEEHGGDVFHGGCPVCKEKCCCTEKTNDCCRKFHCYKKCPRSKISIGSKHAKDDQSPKKRAKKLNTRKVRPTATLFDFPPHMVTVSSDFTLAEKHRVLDLKNQRAPVHSFLPSEVFRHQRNRTHAVRQCQTRLHNESSIATNERSSSSSGASTCLSGYGVSPGGPADCVSYFENMMAREGASAALVTSTISLDAIQNSVSESLLFSKVRGQTYDNDGSSQLSLSLPHALAPPPDALSLLHIFSLSGGETSTSCSRGPAEKLKVEACGSCTNTIDPDCAVIRQTVEQNLSSKSFPDTGDDHSANPPPSSCAPADLTGSVRASRELQPAALPIMSGSEDEETLSETCNSKQTHVSCYSPSESSCSESDSPTHQSQSLVFWSTPLHPTQSHPHVVQHCEEKLSSAAKKGLVKGDDAVGNKRQEMLYLADIERYAV